jgi:hypothetical protein
MKYFGVCFDEALEMYGESESLYNKRKSQVAFSVLLRRVRKIAKSGY